MDVKRNGQLKLRFSKVLTICAQIMLVLYYSTQLTIFCQHFILNNNPALIITVSKTLAIQTNQEGEEDMGQGRKWTVMGRIAAFICFCVFFPKFFLSLSERVGSVVQNKNFDQQLQRVEFNSIYLPKGYFCYFKNPHL